MAAASEADMKPVTRIARCIQAVPRVVVTAGAESEVENISYAFVDSDWAGCRRSRKSTSYGVLTGGGMAAKRGNPTQSSVATSSGEVEY